MKKRSRTEYSVLNIITGLGGYILNTIMGFVCRIVFVRCLSAEYLGVNGLFINILSMLSLAELGIGSAIVYALYKPLAENDEDKIGSLMKVYGTAYKWIGGIIGIVGVAMMPFIHLIIREQPNIVENIYVLYLINLFNTASSYFFSYRSSLLIAAQRNYIVTGINYLITILQSILQMLFLLVFKNYLGYLLIQTIGMLVFNVVVSQISKKQFPFICKKEVPILSIEERKNLFANIRDLTIYKISGVLVNSTDNILITFFNGLATTGLASNYTLLINTLNSILNQIFSGLTASIGNHNASESERKKYEMFSFLNMMNFWIYGWASLGIYFCSSDIVRICFGENYLLPISIPTVLAISFYLSGVTNIVGTYKHTLGLFKQGRFIQIITGMLNLGLSIILGKYWGLFGILLATVIARVCTHLWYTPYVVFRYGFCISTKYYWKKYWGYTGIFLIAACVCKMIFATLSGNYIVQTILKIILCSVITNIVFVFGVFRTKEFAKLIQYKKIILKG